MSKLTDALRAMRIYNNHDLLSRFGKEGHDVWCEYRAPDPRSVGGRKTRVYCVTENTTQGFIGPRSQSMPAALDWASRRYSIDSWAPSPFGGKIPEYVRKAAKQAVDTARLTGKLSALKEFEDKKRKGPGVEKEEKDMEYPYMQELVLDSLDLRNGAMLSDGVRVFFGHKVGDHIDIAVSDGMVEVRGGSSLAVMPQVANVVRINLLRRVLQRKDD